jgi:hypothetical protein
MEHELVLGRETLTAHWRVVSKVRQMEQKKVLQLDSQTVGWKDGLKGV